MEPVLTRGIPSVLSDSAAAEDRADALRKEEVLRLFDSFHIGLLRYASSFGLSAADSEDVVQETFLALFRHLLKGRSQENLRSWLFAVTHNLALKRRSAISRLDRTGEQGEQACRTSMEVPDPSPDPEQEFLLAERRSYLLAVVRGLPERDRWCLELRAEGLRYREIARIAGMSLGSVCTSLRRSLDRLTHISER
jgi:RNA polymerase sigma-70 factor, ECF subfamily